MKKLLLIVFVFLAVAVNAIAQERVITGTVTSADDNKPLPGVSVKVKGTQNGVSADIDGKYTLKVAQGATLEFALIGFVSQTKTVGAASVINVTLISDSKLLNEVVVVAYGSAKKETFTGATANISSAEFEKRPLTNALNAVVGAAPGIQTTIAGGAPGSSAAIRVRGFGSLSASNSALIVLDGVVYDGTLSNINPDDIDNISILKDASTTALYGSRAANGVVMITTKRGKQNTDNLQFKANTGWIDRGLPEYDRVDANTYYPLMWEVQRNTLQYGSLAIPRDIAGQIAAGTLSRYNNNNYTGIKSQLGYNPFNVADNQIVSNAGVLNPAASLLYADDLNWAEQATQGGKQRQNYNLSYSGGGNKSDYFGSLGYTNEEGYLIASGLKRFNGRLSVNSTPVSWLKTGLNLSGNFTKSNFENVDGGTSFINPFFISRFIGPIYPVREHDAQGNLVLDGQGKPKYDFGFSRPFAGGRHTIFENLNDSQRRDRGVLNARTFVTANITKDLKATANVSFDLQDTYERLYDNPILGDGAPAGRAFQYLYRTNSVTFNQLLEYNKQIRKHNVNILAGHENYAYKYNYLSGSRSGQSVDGITELANFATVLGTTSFEDNYTIESYLARANYDFDGKYLATLSFRRDGNSKFASDVRWASFYGVSAGWNIHKENFFDVKWVDQLKLRTSYGELGNDGGISFYAYQALYSLGNNNQNESGFRQSSLENKSLTWETGKNFDVAMEFGLFKGRLSGTVEYFNRVTDGLIFSVPQPSSNGGTTGGNFSISTNIGSLYNKGFEAQITGEVVRTKNFKYTATINATTFKNQITKMPTGQPLIQSGTKGYAVGRSIYDFYLREFYGVDEENGRSLYKTNTLTSNAKIIGTDTVTNVIAEANYRYTGTSSIPDFYGSMNNTFSYKGLSLSVLFTYQVGGQVFDSAYQSLMHGGNYGTALHVDALGRWQNPGDKTSIPRLDNSQITNLTGASTRWLTDASYLQLNNVTLNYALPKNLLAKIKAKTANVFVSGENLALLSKRKGMDVSGSFNGTVGNDYNFSKIVSVGLSLGF